MSSRWHRRRRETKATAEHRLPIACHPELAKDLGGGRLGVSEAVRGVGSEPSGSQGQVVLRAIGGRAPP